MSFWTSTLRKRRKAHRCHTCFQMVAQGDLSYDEAGLCDGDFSSYRQCRACHDIVRYFYWSGIFEQGESHMLCEVSDCAREAGLLWPPVWNWTEDRHV